ncbi:MAG: hypothetical protein NTY19_51085 [Planctomycetota bacterium]|nr:hypothetical protein [Planctomycetota bacterium]
MAQLPRYLLAVLVLLVVIATEARGQTKHRFLGIDNGQNRLLCVDQREPAKGWAVSIPAGSRDLQRLGHERVLVSHGNGAAEYDLATGRKLAWAIDRYSQISSAQRLASGKTLLGANTAAGVVLYELNCEGQEVDQRLLAGLKDLRLARSLANGNVLLTVSGPCRVIEVDLQGQMVWQASLPDKGYKAVRLPNGNTLVSTGGAVTVVELNPAGQEVFVAGGKKSHPNQGLDWFSGFDGLPNGNLVVANWLGHGQQGRGPHLVEFDRQNRVVWKWEDHQLAATITNVLVCDQ